ncbi:hypothetical protein Nepgr_000242 [Nepenthes gracilis]|uniref:Uncharacterized protein n=1 Tax=Nepenthes gracilis TaxID=150966 RepID=A0AAD3P4Y2_NEPGR|nr:hypothetical protein Nepgr_000242 [Nepenthes gracilis]
MTSSTLWILDVAHIRGGALAKQIPSPYYPLPFPLHLIACSREGDIAWHGKDQKTVNRVLSGRPTPENAGMGVLQLASAL